jgi:hypothetical protein
MNLYILLLFFIIIFSCNKITKESTPIPSGNSLDSNLIFYLHDPILRNTHMFDSKKILVRLNKDDISEFINKKIDNRESIFCSKLNNGFQKFEFNITLNKKKYFYGRETIQLNDSVILNSYHTQLVFFNPEDLYIFYPDLSQKITLDNWNNLINFFYLPLYPLGLYPFYEKNLFIKFILVNDIDSRKKIMNCCSMDKIDHNCIESIQSIIKGNMLENGTN